MGDHTQCRALEACTPIALTWYNLGSIKFRMVISHDERYQPFSRYSEIKDVPREAVG